MIVFVVYYYEHYDDYKRAESSGDVINVFTNEEDAYKCAVDNFIKMFLYYEYEYDCSDFINNELSYKENYDIIKEKLYTDILPEAEYTMQPSYKNYFVKEFKI